METLCLLQIPYFNSFINGYSYYTSTGILIEKNKDTIKVKVTYGYMKGHRFEVPKDYIVDMVLINLN